MSDATQPPEVLPPLPPDHKAQLVDRYHPERGPRRHIRIEYDVTDLGDVRQRLLLHYAFRSLFEYERMVTGMTLVEARLQLAKHEGKSGAKAVGNGEPPPPPQVLPPPAP